MPNPNPLLTLIRRQHEEDLEKGFFQLPSVSAPRLATYVKPEDRILLFEDDADLFSSRKLKKIKAINLSTLDSRKHGKSGQDDIPEIEDSGEERNANGLRLTEKQKKQKRTNERANRLDKWYGMTKKEISPEMEIELETIRLRGLLDPKGDKKEQRKIQINPKHFSIATVVNGDKKVGIDTNVSTRSHKKRKITVMKTLGM